MTIIKESGNWYTAEGDPAYTVPNKSKGGFRPTRITDARKLNLCPSVTAIGRVLDAPGLDNWRVDQAFLACATLPEIEGETPDDFIKRAKKDAEAQAKQAREKGTWIHANLKKHYRKEQPDEAAWPYVKGVTEAVTAYCGDQQWRTEQTFAHPAGFGGAVDLHSNAWVLDFKGKDFTENDAAPKAYDENIMQLAAYRFGLDLPLAGCANVFFSRNQPGLAVVVEIEERELERALKMFLHAFEIWKLQKRWTPT